MTDPTKSTINEMKMAVGDLVFRLYDEIYDLSATGREILRERDKLKVEVADLKEKLRRAEIASACRPADPNQPPNP
jgi:regulator of replication initiation timing